MSQHDVIIIGAGAAGLMCAASAGARGRKVLVLDQGKLVEQGNHDSLVTGQGIYAHMWELQQQENADAELTGGKSGPDTSSGGEPEFAV